MPQEGSLACPPDYVGNQGEWVYATLRAEKPTNQQGKAARGKTGCTHAMQTAAVLLQRRPRGSPDGVCTFLFDLTFNLFFKLEELRPASHPFPTPSGRMLLPSPRPGRTALGGGDAAFLLRWSLAL